jgi:hypothetical protein
MSRSHISEQLRQKVKDRAYSLCEYCLLREEDGFRAFQVDHVISEKHRGPTEDHNLCFSCSHCNRSKGSDIGSVLQGRFVRLYNPRIECWSDHFHLDGPLIKARSRIGGATIHVLGLNEPDRLEKRAVLIQAACYPSPQAVRMMNQHG